MDRRNALKWIGFSLAAVKSLTGFWQMVLGQCKDFAEHYNADGGNAKVVYLPRTVRVTSVLNISFLSLEKIYRI